MKCKDGNCDFDRDICCRDCDRFEDCDSACNWTGACEYLEEDKK